MINNYHFHEQKKMAKTLKCPSTENSTMGSQSKKSKDKVKPNLLRRIVYGTLSAITKQPKFFFSVEKNLSELRTQEFSVKQFGPRELPTQQASHYLTKGEW